MQKLLLLICLSLFAPTVHADALDTQLAKQGLTLQKPPDGITETTYSLGTYRVDLQKGNVIIHRAGAGTPKQGTLRLTKKDFTLQGTDRGEWGGRLEYIPKQGKPIVLTSENVIDLIEFKDEIYVLTGIAHLLSNYGTLYRLNTRTQKPTLETVTLFPSCPKFGVVDADSLYVLTYYDLYGIQHGHMRRLITNGPWSRLAPNSMVLKEGAFIIGMHAGITVVKAPDKWRRYQARFYGTK